MEIYCVQHNTVHTVRQHDVEKLIYQYQYRIAEAATTQPLPVGPLTSQDAVIRNAFCVLEDVRKAHPAWRKHVDRLLYRRRSMLRRPMGPNADNPRRPSQRSIAI